jgi:glycine/D-amino acid oxidase-like deaminating enzyme
MASRSRACSMKGAGARCGDRGRTGLWRCLRGCPGQPFARPPQAPGLAAPDLPGEGLLPHLAHRRSGGGARIHRDGRNPQGGGDAPGGPHPGGTAELAGFSLALSRTPAYPGACGAGSLRCRGRPGGCLLLDRPAAHDPDGTPVIGATPYPNLYLATGHGTLGWTMAAGTGRSWRTWVVERGPDIDVAGLAGAVPGVTRRAGAGVWPDWACGTMVLTRMGARQD